MDNKSWTYKKAGVDVESGYEAVRLIKHHASKTLIPGVLGNLGGFGGMFELPQGYKEPVLVSGTDGVGTKLQLAFATGIHNSIGIDCVAMCVNDIVCQGAKPLFFLDYIGTGILQPQQAADIVEGISKACIMAGCALIGGETAEMPGFYKPGEYDLAGFAVGIVEKSQIINGQGICEGDVLIGIASSGLHSNGFSLVRKLCFEVKGFSQEQYFEELGRTLGQELLEPTKIYVKLIDKLTKSFNIKGIANITGGGWFENIPRIFAEQGLKAVVKKNSAPVPAIFKLLQNWGGIEDKDMYATFNMGVGLVLAAGKEDAANILSAVCESGEQAYIIGAVEKAESGEERLVIV